MAAPYFIVGLCGDSNGMTGKYRLTDGTDDAGSRIFQLSHEGTAVSVADEPLLNHGYSAADGQDGQVGSTVALCRLLRDNGHLPSGYDILIVPHCWAGTAFAGFWATTGNRYALDGQPATAAAVGFLSRLEAALALHEDNRIWFFDWNHGANDGGQSEAQYQANMEATWAEIRSTISTASRAPILVPGIPPDRVNPSLGNSNQLNGVIAAQQNVASYLENAAYIDPTGLHSDDTNGYVHFHSAAHRGGTVITGATLGVVGVDPAVDEGEVVTNPLSLRKYNALIQMRFPVRLTWS